MCIRDRHRTLALTLPIGDMFRCFAAVILLLNNSYYLQYPPVDISWHPNLCSHPLQLNSIGSGKVIRKMGKDIWYTTWVFVGHTLTPQLRPVRHGRRPTSSYATAGILLTYILTRKPHLPHGQGHYKTVSPEEVSFFYSSILLYTGQFYVLYLSDHKETFDKC